jgi:heme-degrading monooxygenase HmoA
VIARVWRGLAAPDDANSYLQHLQQTTLPALRQIAGHQGAYVLRRETELSVEFLVLTLWESLDAVRVFAGDDCEVAVVPDAAARLLASYDERVVHYEVELAADKFARRNLLMRLMAPERDAK